jgi:hypothetical protein
MGLRALATESTRVHIGGCLRPQLLFSLILDACQIEPVA